MWNLNYIGSGLVEAHGQIAKYSNIFVNEPIPDLHPMGSDNSPCATVVKVSPPRSTRRPLIYGQQYSPIGSANKANGAVPPRLMMADHGQITRVWHRRPRAAEEYLQRCQVCKHGVV